MSNTNLTPDKILKESLRVLHSKINLIKGVTRQYDKQFAQTGGKIGDTLRIRLPNEFSVRSGSVMQVQDVEQTKVDLTVATQKGVDMNFSSSELAMDIDDFSGQYIKPAMSRLAAELEKDFLASITTAVYNRVGTPGTAPATSLAWLEANQKLNEYLAPSESRHVLMTPRAQAATIGGLDGKFNPGGKISKQYESGEMGGNTLGFDTWSMSQVLPVLTLGTATNTTPLTDAVTAQTGSSLILNGTGNAVTYKAGTTFTIADVYAVNPETKQQYRHLQQFVVTADATANSSNGGEVTLAISPAIVASGVRQNVSNGAANDKAITITGSASTAYGLNLAYQKEFATFVTADLEIDSGAKFCAREVFDGISMRIWRAGDITNDKFPCRLDVLYGHKIIRPNLAALVWE